MSDVTRILGQIESGAAKAAEELLPLVYEELRKLAAAKLAQEHPGQTLQATALVHEAYIRLVDVEKAQQWDSRGHFFAAAAEAMRRILVERARQKQRRREIQGGGILPLDEDLAGRREPSEEVLIVHEALEELERQLPEAAKLVKLRYFAGISVADAASMIGIARSTAYEHWSFARAYLQSRLADHSP